MIRLIAISLIIMGSDGVVIFINREAELDQLEQLYRAQAATDRALLVGECKWTSRPVGTNILTDLQRKARALMGDDAWTQITYAIFAKSGFTPALREIATEQDVLLVEPSQMVG